VSTGRPATQTATTAQIGFLPGPVRAAAELVSVPR
jgi:hypothetical protein